jgi:hypothetical protein
MRRQAGVGALLLIGVGVILGTTVFRSDIAQATGLAQSVTVNNTAAQAVPVREQNLNDAGNIKVHEQGTADVAVNSLPAASSFIRQSYIIGEGEIRSWNFDTFNLSTEVINVLSGTVSVEVYRPDADSDQGDFGQPLIMDVVGPSTVTIPLSETIAINKASAECLYGGGACRFNLSLVGR